MPISRLVCLFFLLFCGSYIDGTYPERKGIPFFFKNRKAKTGLAVKTLSETKQLTASQLTKNADAPNWRLRDPHSVQMPQHQPEPRRWSNNVCWKQEQVATTSHTVLLRFSQLELKKHVVIYFPGCKNNNLLSLSDGWEKASERYSNLSVNSTTCWKNKKRSPCPLERNTFCLSRTSLQELWQLLSA